MSQAATGGAHGGHEDSEHLQHYFESMEQQFDSGKLGIWLFLSTEILLFGGLFCAYAIYRANHPEIFIYAHRYLDKILGGINTLVLLCSSLTMAWAVRCAQLGKQRALKVLLSLTLLGGFGLMGIKGIEYEHKWKHGLLWGKRFAPESHANGGHGEGAAASQATSAAVAGAKAPPLPAPIQTERGVLIERSQIPPAAEAPRCPPAEPSYERLFPEFAAVIAREGDTFPSLAGRYLGDTGMGWFVAEFNGLREVRPGDALVIPLFPFDPFGLTDESYQTVPVLCYHKFSKTVSDKLAPGLRLSGGRSRQTAAPGRR